MGDPTTVIYSPFPSLSLSPFPIRPQYYKLIEQCVSQIVLHKSGIDPDFHHTKKFNVDVDPLIGKSLEEIIFPYMYN